MYSGYDTIRETMQLVKGTETPSLYYTHSPPTTLNERLDNWHYRPAQHFTPRTVPDILDRCVFRIAYDGRSLEPARTHTRETLDPILSPQDVDQLRGNKDHMHAVHQS